MPSSDIEIGQGHRRRRLQRRRDQLEQHADVAVVVGVADLVPQLGDQIALGALQEARPEAPVELVDRLGGEIAGDQRRGGHERGIRASGLLGGAQELEAGAGRRGIAAPVIAQHLAALVEALGAPGIEIGSAAWRGAPSGAAARRGKGDLGGFALSSWLR
jgi:hypothetical protein